MRPIIVTTSILIVAALLSSACERRGGVNTSGPAPSHEQKLWCLAACAVLTQRNQDRHDLLADAELTDANINSVMKSLSEWWEVEDRKTLFESLHWIEQGGHRKIFAEIAFFLRSAEEHELKELESRSNRDPELNNRIDVVRRHSEQLGKKTLLGWDYSRYLSLCRWGYMAGYVSEEEAWSLMLPAARILQGAFDSWEDLGANYLIGREFWSLCNTLESGESYWEAYEYLCSDPGSPWRNIRWDLDLSTARADDVSSEDQSP